MKKTPILILLAFLVGAAGAFSVWGGDAVHLTPDAPEAWLPGDPEPAAPIGIDGTTPRDARDEAPLEGEALAGLEALTREVVADSGGDRRDLVVQVWAGEKGVPAARADVCFLDRRAATGFKDPDPFAAHWSEQTESKGRRFKTDDQGRVRLPPVDGWAMVTAQAPGAFGFARIGREHRAVETITLRVDETVTVRCVDGEGRAVAGVPVGVVQRLPVRRGGTKVQQLRVQMKDLQANADRVERYIRDNPGRRDAALPRVQLIRAQQARLEAAMIGLEGDLGKRRARQRAMQRGRPAPAAAPRGQRSKPAITTREDLRARRRTDAAGIAVFRHFQVYRQQPKSWWPQEHVDQFEAVLLMPLQQPETCAFAGRPVPDETLELRLPPTGSIALRPVDLDGRPFTHPVHADLRMQVADAGQVVPWARVHERRDQNEAVILFPFVGLGLQFTAHCRLDDDDFKWVLPLFRGPSSPGERVTVDLIVTPQEGMLVGRVLDRTGQPLAGRRPTFLINSGAGRLEGEDITLDPAGRFHLPFKVRDSHRGPFRLAIRDAGVRPIAGLTMALPTPARGRVTDLGDLHLEDLECIAFGAVVDDRGQPIPGASVQLQRQRDVGGKHHKLAFVDEAFVVGRVDEGGRYELFGALDAGRYRLRVQARGHFPLESNDLRQGAQVDLQLLRNSRVVGTVLTPPWLKSRSLRVELLSAADPKQRRDVRVHDHKGEKYIYVDWVRPAIYSVLIRVEEFPDPILRIDGLEILPGQQGVHPRLQNLDLASHLFRFELAAVDGRGQPIQPDWPLIARITRPGGQTGFVGFPWKGRKLEVISASPELEVLPLAAGYRAERTVLGPGPSELRFLEIPPLELHLPGLRELVGGVRVWIALPPDGQGSPSSGAMPRQLERWDGRSKKIAGWYADKQRRRGGIMLGQGDTLRIPMMEQGRFQVIAYLLGRSKQRPVPVALGRIDVRHQPDAGPQRVTVKVDAERLRQALAELARRDAAGGARGGQGGQRRVP